MSETGDLERVVATLSARLRAVEDRLAILDLLGAYGPAVDSGASRSASQLWTTDGIYDVGDVSRVEGQAAIEELFEGEQHQGIIAGGSAHVTPSPTIRIDGDNAVAIGYSLVFRRQGDGFLAWRASANRWTLRRTPTGWRIVERFNRVLDGSPEARRLLAEGV
jgi:hypothetical protein